MNSEFRGKAEYQQEIEALKQKIADLEKSTQALRAAKAALRVSESKFSTAFYTSPDSININRLSDGLYLEINQGFTNLTGYTAEDVEGKTSLELDIWANPADREQLVAGLRESGEVRNLEALFRLKNGDVRVGLMSAKVIQVGEEVCILSVTRDISERKEAEKKIQELNQHLEQRVKERTAQLESFTFSVSHDLRAPLRAIKGFSQILQDEFASSLDAEGQEYVKRIRDASQKMSDLIDGMLLLSRMSQQEIVLEPLDISELAQKIMGELLQEADGRHINFQIRPSKHGWRVDKADQRLLEIMMTNLLSNALKFTRTVNPAVIELSNCIEDKLQVFCLSDNGVGFDSRAADKIFFPFHRAHAEDQFEGTGIGLAIVKQIVERHRGQIWAESQPGKGAKFFFTLERHKKG